MGGRKEEMEAIYVVDDDRDTLEMVGIILKSAGITAENGYCVRLFNDPVKLVEAVEQRPPRILLSDLAMPIISGSDLLGIYTQVEWTKNTSIIIMSANPRDKVDLKGADWVQKPFDIDELVESVKSRLNGSFSQFTSEPQV